ncbi:L,D-transpeptidase [Dyella sp. KRB-257]|uniref:L,D-transpeptidase n=1 Tax=Dyella sp. KRB-257 TaxID=3400915 RepID=UPI003C03F242
MRRVIPAPWPVALNAAAGHHRWAIACLLVTLTTIACHAANARPEAVDVAGSPVSGGVTDLARWVIATHNNAGMPYLIIDKINAAVFAFDAAGHLQGTTPALLGLARGDRSVEGIGDLKMSAIRPQDRITPAGRFVASLGHDPHGKEILWIDYKDAIALHPVVKGTPQERRAERLRSATSADNRISYGCINVPLKFYERFVSPAFAHTSGLVYILPESSSAQAVFGSSGIESDAKSSAPAQP